MKGIDFTPVIAGAIAAFLKAIKRRLKWRMILISVIIGGVLGFGVIGVLSYFLKNISVNLIVLTAFASGWVASEFTDVLEEAVQDGYDMVKAYARARFETRKRNRNSKSENDEQ